MNFKVEIRKNCKVCEKPIENKRSRTYCSPGCRNKFYNKKYSKQHSEWQRKRNDKAASESSPDKVQCLICKKWYIQVCNHVIQRHGIISAREYKELYDLEVKGGVVPKWYKELKGSIALNNGTSKNLENGKRFRFIPGDKRAGRYTRSHITIERLRGLSKFRKNANNER